MSIRGERRVTLSSLWPINYLYEGFLIREISTIEKQKTRNDEECINTE
jgi:hypothetical protein